MARLARTLARYGRGALRRVSQAAYVAQAGAAGWRLRDPLRVRDYERLLDLAHRFGLNVGTVLYIGANNGQELPLLAEAFPRAVIHCFEPQAECQAQLRQRGARSPHRVHLHGVALSDTSGEAVLHKPLSHIQAASLLSPNQQMSTAFPHVRNWRDEVVSTVRLDDWAAANDLQDDIVIKMDVQGAEDRVISGGPGVFGRARLVICEMSITATYDGSPDWKYMIDVMSNLGFRYAGELSQVRDEHGTVVEFDGAFVRIRD